MTAPLFVPTAETSRAFRDALGSFATGVTVVTTATPDGPMGFTANSFSSVSLDPPLVLWSPAKTAQRFAVYATAGHFTIHVLGVEQSALGARFLRGGQGFDGLAHEISPEGCPAIPGTLSRFDCALHASHDGGDHLIIVGRVLRAASREGSPLVFSRGAYGGFVHGGV